MEGHVESFVVNVLSTLDLGVTFLFLVGLVSLIAGRKAPYFPIEISRMIAQSTIASIVLFFGMLASFFFTPIWHRASQSPAFYVCLAGIFFVVVFDDVRFYALHMLGVFLVLSGHALRSYETQQSSIFFAAFFLWFFRILLKGFAVWRFESAPSSRHARDLGQKIMFEGHSACSKPHLTMPVFKLAGALQWVVFWLLTSLW